MAYAEKRGNKYRIVCSAGYTRDGKQIKKSKTWTPPPGASEAKIKKLLEIEKNNFELDCQAEGYIRSNTKLGAFIEIWFERYAVDHVRTSTYERYKGLYKRVDKCLGHIPLDRLQPQHLLGFYQQLAKPGVNEVRKSEGLSPKTIKEYHYFLSSVLTRAEKWRIISDNPIRRIDPPKSKKPKVACLNLEQTKLFLDALKRYEPHYQVLFYLEVLTGMRRGEVLGLEWNDFDFEKRTVTISRTSMYSKEKGFYVGEPKTESGNRTLSLPTEMIELLIKYRIYQASKILAMGDQWDPGWTEHPRLFTQQNGLPMYPNQPYKRLQKILKDIDLPQISMHDLRHTNATLLIDLGTKPQNVSSMLGHAQTSTTMNIYVHSLQSAEEVAAETLADHLLRDNAKRA